MKEVVAELVVLTVREERLSALLVRLPGNLWRLPGAPVPEGVGVEEAAVGALARQTGIGGVALEQLYTFDRAQATALCVAHLALLAADRHPLAPGPDVVEVRWFDLDDAAAVIDPASAEVLAYGHARLRAKASYAPVPVHLLADTFTLGELQAAYEAVLGRPLDPRNFRRDVLAAGALAEAGVAKHEGPGRRARLYRATGEPFQALGSERRIARAIAAARPTSG